jgi:hypothetical protein
MAERQSMTDAIIGHPRASLSRLQIGPGPVPKTETESNESDIRRRRIALTIVSILVGLARWFQGGGKPT